MKKIFISIVILLGLALAGFYVMYGKSNYDATKYSLKITPENKPFGVGSAIEFTLPDQFNKTHTNKDTKVLIFAFTKATGHIVRSFMADKPKDYLDKKGAVIVADISKMPTVILNSFAMPDLQKSNYPMMLIYDGKMAKKLEEGKDKSKVVVMTLDNNKVSKIEYANSIEELGKLLK